MYTNDGLLINTGRIGPHHGGSGGWIDSGFGITAFTHSNGTKYVYAEEVKYGKSIRYRVDGLETLSRFNGSFSWGEVPSFVVTNTNDSGPGSLRQAMLYANWNPGPDSIEFDIAGTGIHTINLVTALPSMEEAITIDGSTQPGYAGSPLIELTGSGITDTYAHGIELEDGHSTVRGLVINDFSGNGIFVAGNFGSPNAETLIEDNFIGTNAAGTAAAGNGYYGIQTNLTFAGPVDEPWIVIRNNLVSGHTRSNYGGIQISNTNHVQVVGNKIGTDVTGTVAIPNFHGIGVDGSSGNWIGGLGPGDGNLISGNQGNAISIARSHSINNVVQGNLIGTDIHGTSLLPNSRTGVQFSLDAQNNLVGGPEPEARNIFAGGNYAVDNGHGINNTIQNNFMGTDITGTQWFFHKNSSVVAGNDSLVIDNLMTGSSQGSAVRLAGSASNNVFAGNLIGTNSAGDDLGGWHHGIEFFAYQGNAPTNNLFQENVIANHLGDGVHMDDGTGNAFVSNVIYNNAGTFGSSIGLGLDMGGDGLTPNDAGDTDGIQNFPVLVSAVAGGNQTPVSGTLSSAANSTYRIEFFTASTGDASGHGEAGEYLGFIEVTTDAAGDATFNTSLLVTVSAGHILTATATRLVDHDVDASTPLVPRDTSEFAANLTIGANTAPTANGVAVLTDEDTVLNGSVAALGDDLDGDLLSFSLETDAANGTVTVNPDGTFNYTPVENFNGSDSFVYRVSDGDLFATAIVSITVNAINDVADIGGDLAVATDEDTASVAGALTVADVDAGEESFVAQTGTAGDHGTFDLDTNGDWTYAVDVTSLQSLTSSDQVIDSFEVVTADGTTETVDITIDGLNDVAVIGGDLAPTTDEDTVAESGTLAVTDIDAGEGSFVAQSGTVGDHGSFDLDTNGNWVYTLDVASLQSLTAADQVIDSFEVVTDDGTTSSVDITIDGLNDAAVVGGDLARITNEDTETESGTLTVTDADTGQASFIAQTGLNGDYGVFDLDANGNWTYTLDVASLQSLTATDQVIDSFEVETADGTTATVDITIGGLNDAAIIDGDLTRSTNEDTLSEAGALTIADADSGQSSFVAQVGTSGDHGTFDMDVNGNWTYTLDIVSLQSMIDTDQVVDSFEVEAADGTIAIVEITIDGLNDAPVAGDDAVVTDEDNDVVIAVMDNDNDIDGTITPSMVVNPTNGTVTVNIDGTITYSPDADFHGVDSFVYAATDDGGLLNTAVVTITVNSVNDAPVATVTQLPLTVANRSQSIWPTMILTLKADSILPPSPSLHSRCMEQ